MNNELNFIRNKKSIMCFAALQIIIFHMWVTVFPESSVEAFFRRTAYTGVDIFFFLSIYAITQRGLDDLKGYYISRFRQVYLKFAVFTLISAVMSGFGVVRLLKILTGVDMLMNGGGAFLGFVPAIMLFYIVFPIVHKLLSPHPTAGAAVVMGIYFAVGILATNCIDYPALYIFWNRLPILVLGYLSAVYSKQLGAFFSGKRGLARRLIIAAVLCLTGFQLLYFFGCNIKLSSPINEMYYVMGIPAILGYILLADIIPAGRIVNLIGSATLEMYMIQMLWGFALANYIFKVSRSPMLTNVAMIAILALLGIAVSMVFKLLTERIPMYIRCKK